MTDDLSLAHFVILILLAYVATFRVSRLITADTITEPIRVWIDRRSRWFGDLVTCDWCVSVWLCPIPTVAVLYFPNNRLVLGILIAASISGVVGLLSTWERTRGDVTLDVEMEIEEG